MIAHNETGDSDPSDPSTVTILPPAPSGLSVSQGDDTSHVKLTWTDNGSPALEEGFEIERSTDGINFSQVATVGAFEQPYIDSLPDTRAPVSYRVCSYNGGGNSSWSNIATYSLSQWQTSGEASVSGGTITLGVAGRAEDETQPSGVHGAWLLLPAQSQYTVSFTYDLSTWDSYNAYTGPGTGYWDSFSVSVSDKPYSQMGYVDPVNLPFVWGGQEYGGHVLQTTSGSETLTIPGNPNGANYLNVVLDTGTTTDADGAYPSWGTIQITQPSQPPKVTLTPYRAGNNEGQAVAADVKQGGDPTQYVLLVNDDYTEHPDGSQPDDADNTALIEGDQLVAGPDGDLDTDLAKITLHVDDVSDVHDGKLLLTLSDPASVRLFDDNGQPLTDTSVDLSSPSGYLAPLAGGTDVDVWVEALKTNSDFVFKLSYQDADGNEVSRDTVHMDLAQWSFVGKDGNPLTSVDKDAEQLLADDATADPNAPQAADSVYYKIKIDGLPTSAVDSLTVQSDSVSGDSYTDDFPSSTTTVESSDFGVLYTPPDDGTDLTPQQIGDMKQMYHLNVVHNPQADATAAMGKDSYTRSLKGSSASFTAQDLYNWVTTDPGYGDKVKFVLDRMDWQADGNDYHKRIVVSPLSSAAGTWTYTGGKPSQDGKDVGRIYINSTDTKQQAIDALLNGLRVWAGYGAQGIMGTGGASGRGSNDVQKPYFASIARQWARQFYWTIDTSVPIDETFSGTLPAYHGTVNPNATGNAAVQSLAATLDFLYFFSSGEAPDQLDRRMYAPKLDGPESSRPTLPSLYLWVFSNRSSIVKGSSSFAVNIPSDHGLNADYYEASTLTTSVHDTPSVLVLRSSGPPTVTAWPQEDQLHHFAGYFYLGCLIQANSGTVSIGYVQRKRLALEKGALQKTGDWPKSWNPGDYDLGLVADDLGAAYEAKPGYSAGIPIWQDLSSTAPQAYTTDGRTQFP